MLLSYLKISLRKLFKFKRDRSSVYSWINLGGLTIGLTAFLLIGHFVKKEIYDPAGKCSSNKFYSQYR